MEEQFTFISCIKQDFAKPRFEGKTCFSLGIEYVKKVHVVGITSLALQLHFRHPNMLIFTEVRIVNNYGRCYSNQRYKDWAAIGLGLPSFRLMNPNRSATPFPRTETQDGRQEAPHWFRTGYATKIQRMVTPNNEARSVQIFALPFHPDRRYALAPLPWKC